MRTEPLHQAEHACAMRLLLVPQPGRRRRGLDRPDNGPDIHDMHQGRRAWSRNLGEDPVQEIIQRGDVTGILAKHRRACRLENQRQWSREARTVSDYQPSTRDRHRRGVVVGSPGDLVAKTVDFADGGLLETHRRQSFGRQEHAAICSEQLDVAGVLAAVRCSPRQASVRPYLGRKRPVHDEAGERRWHMTSPPSRLVRIRHRMPQHLKNRVEQNGMDDMPGRIRSRDAGEHLAVATEDLADPLERRAIFETLLGGEPVVLGCGEPPSATTADGRDVDRRQLLGCNRTQSGGGMPHETLLAAAGKARHGEAAIDQRVDSQLQPSVSAFIQHEHFLEAHGFDLPLVTCAPRLAAPTASARSR